MIDAEFVKAVRGKLALKASYEEYALALERLRKKRDEIDEKNQLLDAKLRELSPKEMRIEECRYVKVDGKLFVVHFACMGGIQVHEVTTES